jgi:hypothetical protein
MEQSTTHSVWAAKIDQLMECKQVTALCFETRTKHKYAFSEQKDEFLTFKIMVLKVTTGFKSVNRMFTEMVKH